MPHKEARDIHSQMLLPTSSGNDTLNEDSIGSNWIVLKELK